MNTPEGTSEDASTTPSSGEPRSGASPMLEGSRATKTTSAGISAEATSAGVASAEVTADPSVDRAKVVGVWLTLLSRWSGRTIIAVLGVALVFWGLSFLWAGLLPVILALIVTALLTPLKTTLRRVGLGDTLSAMLTVLISLAVVLGTFIFIIPDVVQQFRSVGQAALDGAQQVQEWLAGPPLDISTDQIDDAVSQAVGWVQNRSADIASGAIGGVSAVGSVVVNIILVLALTFLFLKDGHRFLGWQQSVVGEGAGRHLTEVLARNWKVLGGFIRTQALVSAIDAVFIGIGLLVLQVPLALALTVITFFAGFIPIIGAITAGFLAVLVALVTNGWQTALIVLLIILAVQQLEGNVLSPMLQGKTMNVHAGLILVAVTIGGTLFGLVGVFLAVPFTACLVATGRYAGEQLDLRTGHVTADGVRAETDQGKLTATDGQRRADFYRASPVAVHGTETAAIDEVVDHPPPPDPEPGR
ncbi:MAG: AI-2E family transporter [Ornithinimicrobium sp.]